MAFEDDEDYSDKPVEEGKTYEVTVEDLGSKGDGIARVDGFVVFVPETEVGEVVEIEISSVGRKFAFGEVVERLGTADDVDGDAEDDDDEVELEPEAPEPVEPEEDDDEDDEPLTAADGMGDISDQFDDDIEEL